MSYIIALLLVYNVIFCVGDSPEDTSQHHVAPSVQNGFSSTTLDEPSIRTVVDKVSSYTSKEFLIVTISLTEKGYVLNLMTWEGQLQVGGSEEVALLSPEQGDRFVVLLNNTLWCDIEIHGPIQNKYYLPNVGVSGLHSIVVALVSRNLDVQLSSGIFTVLVPSFDSTSPSKDAFMMTVQVRNIKTEEIMQEVEYWNPMETGIVLVDTWDYHWCMTASSRVQAMVPRFNKMLDALRSMGVAVFWALGEATESYAGYPQRETVLFSPKSSLRSHHHQHHHHQHHVNHSYTITPQCTFNQSTCMCGPYDRQCMYHQGMRKMTEGLHLDERDMIVQNAVELDAMLRKSRRRQLIYAGFHANECLLKKPASLQALQSRGYRCVIARDMTDAMCGRAHVDFNLENEVISIIKQLEIAQIPTVNMETTLRNLGKWNNSLVDMVRYAPWGKRDRPFVYEKRIKVILSLASDCIQDHSCFITYTLNRTLPTPGSLLYTNVGLIVASSVTITGAAFDSITQERKTEYSECVVMRLPDTLPPPTVSLSSLVPLQSTVFRTSTYNAIKGSEEDPNEFSHKIDAAYSGSRLQIRRIKLKDGIGVHAPSRLMYEILPEYKEFVSACGIDEGIINQDYGFLTSSYPSVICRVFIDGILISESPVMKLFIEAWRFRIDIPPNSKILSLVVSDAGDGNRYDMASWMQAGFIVVV